MKRAKSAGKTHCQACLPLSIDGMAFSGHNGHSKADPGSETIPEMTAALTAVPRSGYKLSVFQLRTFSPKRTLSALRADKTIFCLVIGHVFDPGIIYVDFIPYGHTSSALLLTTQSQRKQDAGPTLSGQSRILFLSHLSCSMPCVRICHFIRQHRRKHFCGAFWHAGCSP